MTPERSARSSWGALLCDLGDAYDHAGQTEAAQATYAEAVDLATLCNDTIGLARSVLGLMGGVDETVGFNLTGTDGALVAMLDDIRIRLPEDEIALRALVTARVAGARYDAGEVERAQELSSEALDLAAHVGRRARDRDRSGRAAHRAVVPGGARRPPAPRRGAARARAVVLGAGRGVAGRGPARVRPARGRGSQRWRRWRRRRSPAHCHVRRTTSRSTGQCARRSTVTSTKRRAAARKPARSDEQVGARRAGLSYAVQSLFVARERRELDGLVEVLDALAAEHPNQPGFLTTAAWVRIETGRFDEARVQFDAIGADGFASILRNGVWLPNMRLLSEIAYALATPGPAATLYELMLPYRDRYIVTSRVLSFLGSVEHSLGTLSITTGDLDRADAHLAQARANHVGLGAPLLVARTDLAIAALHEARGDTARRRRAPGTPARRGHRERLARPRHGRGGRRGLNGTRRGF